MPDAPLKMMECLTCSVSDRMSIGIDIAYTLLKMLSFLSVVVGILLGAAFIIAKYCFALYMVDSIFRLNMILIILPFLIMSYPFEQTRKWSITGFKIIINSSVIMLCLVVMTVMAILALQNILLTGGKDGFDFANVTAFEDFGVVPMALIFTAFLIVKISGLAVSLADRITTGGGQTEFQRKVQQLVGTFGQFILAATFGKIGSGINSLFDKAAQHSETLRYMRRKLNQLSTFKDKLAGRLPPSEGQQGTQGGDDDQ